MRLIKGFIVLGLLTVLGVGCTEDSGGSGGTTDNVISPSEDGSNLEVRRIEVEGRTVTCVIFRDFQKGGVSCDFANELYHRG